MGSLKSIIQKEKKTLMLFNIEFFTTVPNSLSLSLSSYPPFFDEHPFRIYEKILEGKIDWARHLEPTAKDLIKKLLVRDVTRRLGSLKVKTQGREKKGEGSS